MSKEMYRVTTKVYPTSMAIYYITDDDDDTNLTTITTDDVWGCDDYKEFQETILELIEERVGFKLEEHERAWVDLDIQIWSNYFSRL